MKIGVLALQGDFELHRKALARVTLDPGGVGGRLPDPHDDPGGVGGRLPDPHDERAERVESVEIRKPEQLDAVEGLIIPGGESTTLLKLMEHWGFVPAIEKFHGAGKPIFGTCAGLILVAREVERPRQFSLGLIDVAVERNAYGRQRESFETRGEVDLDGRRELEMVFIRAPRIRRVGPDVSVLAVHRDEPVMARQDTVLVAAFHPELTDDPSVHEYFCKMVVRSRSVPSAP